MWYLRWNVHYVTRIELLSCATLNRFAPNFVRLNRLRIDDGPTNYESSFAAIHDKDVGLGFVHFGAAVALAI